MSALTRHILRDHLLAGTTVAVIAMFFFGWIPAAIFLLASIFIDVDHWFVFLYRTKFRFWSPGSMMRFYESVSCQKDSKDFLSIDIFHTIEFVCLLGVLSFTLLPGLQPVFWGVMFHLSVDGIYLTHLGALRKRCYSLWEYNARSKRLTSQGLDPAAVFHRAAKSLEHNSVNGPKS